MTLEELVAKFQQARLALAALREDPEPSLRVVLARDPSGWFVDATPIIPESPQRFGTPEEALEAGLAAFLQRLADRRIAAQDKINAINQRIAAAEKVLGG